MMLNILERRFVLLGVDLYQVSAGPGGIQRGAIYAPQLIVVDVTDPDKPRKVPGATVPLKEAYRIYVARTYAYVGAGAAGLAAARQVREAGRSFVVLEAR